MSWPTSIFLSVLIVAVTWLAARYISYVEEKNGKKEEN